VKTYAVVYSPEARVHFAELYRYIAGAAPFIYVIRANGRGDILFMGRVENPAEDGG
jgi:serine protease inhibitor